MVTLSVEPTLKISPLVEPSSSRPCNARIASATWQKQRVWVPSPWISIGSPASARSTIRGITIPYCPLCRGPTVLNRRTITQSRPRSWWYARARNSSSAFDSAYAQRRAVVGP